MVKCPACGFESADGASWCDFCKEPFRKAGRAPAPAPSPEAAAPQAAGEKKQGLPWDEIPSEILALDSGGKIPSLPPWVRRAAWAVLGAWVIMLMVLVGAYLGRQKALEQGAAVPQRPSP